MSQASASNASPEFQRGLIVTIATFFAWGLFPLYWRELAVVPSFQITAHRITWCAVFVVAFLIWRDGLGWLRRSLAPPRALPLLMVSSVLISINWVLYIWAVNAGNVVETALGYYINPLINVLIGVLVLREKLNARQWIAVSIAAAGVAWLTWGVGRFPWIALTLATSFAFYGLIRKQVSVESVPGLGVESLIMFLPSLGFLIWCEQIGEGSFGHVDLYKNTLLIGAGIATALPLIGFAYGARRIPLSLVGIVQYLGPTLQLLIGVFLFGEAFSQDRAIGFGLIWLALALYAFDGVWRLRIRGYG
tara:strand:+ start:4359 stop:5273 length:915 start_codon:yes stop_codon:yes gene_type:complete